MLVVFVIYVFLRSVRATVIPAVAIPVSIIGTFSFLYFAGFSINTLSLLGLVLAIGIVVDDAIVVGESTHVEQSRTGDKLRGAILGAQTLVIPVAFGVLTTIAAFTPLAFLPGPMGQMSRVLPMIVISCLIFSLIEAMLILPAHLGHGRKPLNAEASTLISKGWRRFQGRVAGGLQYVIEQRRRDRRPHSPCSDRPPRARDSDARGRARGARHPKARYE